MPKRRILRPDSIHSRKNIEKWLTEDLGVSSTHRIRIWKKLLAPNAIQQQHKQKQKQKESSHGESNVSSKRDEMGGKEEKQTEQEKPFPLVCSIRDVPHLPQKVYDEFETDSDDSPLYVMSTSQVVEETRNENGGKLVIKLQDGHLIETVIILHQQRQSQSDSAKHKNNSHDIDLNQQKSGRATVCVSSQVGCQMGCTFCATGTMNLLASLTAAEIVEQVYHARQRYSDVGNVVFMGMGEPLDNYEAVKEAILSMTEPSGLSIPYTRITLSTVGVTHGIRKLAKECPEVRLALSLHAPTDEIRQKIVPSNKAFSLPKIMEAVQLYQDAPPSNPSNILHTLQLCNGTLALKKQRKAARLKLRQSSTNHKSSSSNIPRSVMIEYIMIDQINSTVECAHLLGKLLQGGNFLINLIPYNPTEAGDRYNFRAPSDQVMEEFRTVLTTQYESHLEGKYLPCTIRWSSRRGQNIDAACGQLALKNIKAAKTTTTNTTTIPNAKTSKNVHSNVPDIEDLCVISTHKNEKPVRMKNRTKHNASKLIHPKQDIEIKETRKLWWIIPACTLFTLSSLFIVKKIMFE